MKQGSNTGIKIFVAMIMILIMSLSANCGGGGGGSSSDGVTNIGDNDGDIIEVDPIFVRTGIASSTVIDIDYRSIVYVGRLFYQQGESEFDLSFNPSKNFLKNLEVDE